MAVDLKDLTIAPEPVPVCEPAANPMWYVVLTEPQQEIRAVWRLQEHGLELFVPVVRKRVKTGRMGKNGQKVTRIVARPMFPGYGFIRAQGGAGLDTVCSTRGVRGLLLINQKPVLLPGAAIRAVFKVQIEQQHEWIRESGRKESIWKVGDRVRVDGDSVYAGLIAQIDKVDGKGRVELLLGMIRHTLPADMVVSV